MITPYYRFYALTLFISEAKSKIKIIFHSTLFGGKHCTPPKNILENANGFSSAKCP